MYKLYFLALCDVTRGQFNKVLYGTLEVGLNFFPFLRNSLIK